MKDKKAKKRASVIPPQSSKSLAHEVSARNKLPELSAIFETRLLAMGDFSQEYAAQHALAMAKEVERRLPNGSMYIASLTLAELFGRIRHSEDSASVQALAKALKRFDVNLSNVQHAADLVLETVAWDTLSHLDTEIEQTRMDRLALTEMQRRHPEVRGGKKLEQKLDSLRKERAELIEQYPELAGVDDE